MREIKFRCWDGKEIIEWNTCKDFDTPEQLFKPDMADWEIMQFTGLKDKHGVEIFEGDIVKGISDKYDGKDFDFVGKVHFHDDLGMFDIYGYCEQPLRFFKSLEIIGNIYSNPELLK